MTETLEPITLATLASGLRAIARVDVRDLPPRSVEPFRCLRCLDVGTVSDWANWCPAWLWQRYRPVPRIPCPDCSQMEPYVIDSDTVAFNDQVGP
jgi:hypothetical protein